MIRLFRVFVPTSVVALLLSEIILTYTCYVIAAFVVLDVDPQVFLLYDNGWVRIAIVVACIMLGVYFHDLYTQFRIKSRILLFQQIGVVLGLAFLMKSLLVYLRLRVLLLHTWLMIGGSTLVIIILPTWRIFYSTVVLRAMGSERVLLLGASSLVQEIARHFLEHPETGFKVLGYVENLEIGAELPGGAVLGHISELRRIVNELKPERIVVGMAERRARLPVNDLLEMRLSGIHIEDALTTYEATFGRISTRELRPSQLVFSTELGPNQARVMLQSIYSLGIAIVGTVILSPVMLLVFLLVRLSSRGPGLYRQRRVGKNDVPFTLYKFRSMFTDAEAESGAVWAQKDDPRVTWVGKWLRRLRLDELPQLFNVLKGEMNSWGSSSRRSRRNHFPTQVARGSSFWAQTDDPRVTWVGKWLRRLRLDELPQLFNVLKGEMSIVGPRPERPEFDISPFSTLNS